MADSTKKKLVNINGELIEDQLCVEPGTEDDSALHGLMCPSDKTKLDGIEEGANKYTHPSYTARTGNPTANQTPAFGGTATVSQITSDATGHVTAATDRTITIPSTLSNGTGTAGLIKTSSSVTSNSGYTACPVISGVPYYKDTDTVYTHPTYTARTGNPTANATLTHGGTFTVTQPVSDGTGHITAMNTRTYTMPSETSLSGGSKAAADNTVVGGVTVNGHAVTVGKKTLTGGSNVTITGTANTITISSSYTDTVNTAGSTDTSSKIFLIGATSQATSPQTYSHDTAYVGTDGHLYSASSQVVNLATDQTISAVKTFTNGINIGSANLAYSSDDNALIVTFA